MNPTTCRRHTRQPVGDIHDDNTPPLGGVCRLSASGVQSTEHAGATGSHISARRPILVNSIAPAANGPSRYSLRPDDCELVMRCMVDAILAQIRINSPAMVGSPTGSHHAAGGRR